MERGVPQISKGARLYPYRREGRETVYVIRDGEYFRSTGFSLDERDAANTALANYIRSKRPDTGRTNADQIWVAEVLKLYALDQPPNKPSLATIGYHMKALEPYWGDKRLSEVKGSTCRAYTTKRVKAGVVESTARRELKTLSAAINHWHRESPLEAVPAVTLPDEGERRERVLEVKEVAAMLRACRTRKWTYVARFILIGLYTGTRHDALLKLRWSPALVGGHVDLERGIIYRRGKAEKETSKRRPPVRASLKLHRLLKGWAKRDAKLDLAIVIHYRGKPIAGKLRSAWETIREDAGLGEDVTPHVLRHTCATWNLWAGKDIWEVAGIIGADASTVERVYGHHKLETVAQSVARKVA